MLGHERNIQVQHRTCTRKYYNKRARYFFPFWTLRYFLAFLSSLIFSLLFLGGRNDECVIAHTEVCLGMVGPCMHNRVHCTWRSLHIHLWKRNTDIANCPTYMAHVTANICVLSSTNYKYVEAEEKYIPVQSSYTSPAYQSAGQRLTPTKLPVVAMHFDIDITLI